MFSCGTNFNAEVARKLNWLLSQICLVLLLARSDVLQAGPIIVPNPSFESPATFFVSVIFDSWQRTSQPAGWDENASGPWTNLTGIFKNTAPGSYDHIENCDGNQAMWLFASPEAGLFQDYDSVDWNDPLPTHAFDARFEAGRSYQLKVGLLVGGMGSGGGILPGATLDLCLYYRDASSNRVTVAATTITNSLSVFSNSTQLIDYAVDVPTVRPDDAWAGQHIGILLLSTVTPALEGGYWDLDNVRLVSVLAPTLGNPAHANGQFQFLLQSEPGMAVEILASTNAALPVFNWSSLATLTNVAGTITLVDTNANFDQRFYQARQLP
jgi:hypothetical protein